uniref:Uncharacterized protein n=1 Tax=Arundo donax TaxID=35708 RepID=A0A0A9HAQ7_ARUDO
MNQTKVILTRMNSEIMHTDVATLQGVMNLFSRLATHSEWSQRWDCPAYTF